MLNSSIFIGFHSTSLQSLSGAPFHCPQDVSSPQYLTGVQRTSHSPTSFILSQTTSHSSMNEFLFTFFSWKSIFSISNWAYKQVKLVEVFFALSNKKLCSISQRKGYLVSKMTDKATPFTEPGVYSWHDQLKQQTMTNIFSKSKPEKICRVVSSSLPFPDSLLCHLPAVAGFVVGLKET